MKGLLEKRIRMGRPPKRRLAEIPPWAQRIGQARQRAGLTQEELSGRVSRSVSSVSEWELGKSQPNLAQFHAIAEATGVDEAWLILGRDPGGDDAMLRILAKAEKENRHFAWVFVECARILADEGVKADLAYLISYTQQILTAADDFTDDTSAKVALARKLDAERADLRADMDKIRQKRVNPKKPETSG